MPIQEILAALPLIPIIGLVMVFVLSRRSPGRTPTSVIRAAGFAGHLLSLTAVAALGTLLLVGPAESPVGLIRLDIVSTPLFALVALLGWVTLRFSARYLEGESRHGAFLGWMALTIAGALAFVTAGTLVQLALGWIAMSLALNPLLTFYSERRGARLAAAKAFWIARASDVALVAALALIWQGFETSSISAILSAAKTESAPQGLTTATAMLAFAAVLRSAQVPLMGWLVEVMETPTPVSALLHAGIVNAGGMLLIRFADVLVLTPGVLIGLALIGGLTALWGSLAMLAQPAVKTALAWSTVGQMGFMVLQCGLALFPLALLHILAHSVYKAHAFLRASSAVVAPKPTMTAQPQDGGLSAMLAAAGGAILVAALVVASQIGTPVQAIALAMVLALGLLPLLTGATASLGSDRPDPRLLMAAPGIALLYLGLHAIMAGLTSGALPPAPAPTPGVWFVLVLTVLGFGIVAIAQAMRSRWQSHPIALRLRWHMANGFYAPALLHHIAGGFRAPPKTAPPRMPTPVKGT